MTSTVLVLETIQSKVSDLTRQSYNDGREHLNNLEIEELLKMTNDLVSKIKLQAQERAL